MATKIDKDIRKLSWTCHLCGEMVPREAGKYWSDKQIRSENGVPLTLHIHTECRIKKDSQ